MNRAEEKRKQFRSWIAQNAVEYVAGLVLIVYTSAEMGLI